MTAPSSSNSASSSAAPDAPEPPAETGASPSDFAEAPPDPPAPSDPSEVPPPTPSFPAIVTSLTVPPPPTEPLGPEHHALFNHLATSFVPSNQPCASSSPDRQILLPDGGMQIPKKRAEAVEDEPVIALVCPFEGGDAYISQAVNEVAGHLSADVVRLDLALGVGFDGPHAPLSETGT